MVIVLHGVCFSRSWESVLENISTYDERVVGGDE